ncbi:MAG: hypothetical protein PHV33_11200 [Elusimicrobiales bacterium]|nr:hypothetical protein [Elusimicrobiales bacterium]
MNETEAAKLFNEELDALLRDGRGPVSSGDPGALALAGELARADFSGESLIRESLRERLVGGASLAGYLRGLFANPYARAAFAAAALLIALLPLARRQPGPGPETALPRVTPQSVAALPPLPRAKVSGGAPGAGLFASLPMGRLEAQPLKEFPIGQAGAGLPMTLAEGRPIPQARGGGVVLQTESAPFPIENRPVSAEEIFERRTL